MFLVLRKLPNRSRQNQSGMASIVVVSVLVIILTLITIGFSKIMDRAQNDATSAQLGSGAYYAARSGINDAAAYLAANPTASATQCNDLIGTGQPLNNASNIGGDGITKYNCVLINQTPSDLIYQKEPAFKSQVIKLDVGAGNSLDSLMVSWQSSDRSHNRLLGSSATTLMDEISWGNALYEPVLRVTLYPTNSLAVNSLATTASDAKTFFVLPSSVGSKSFDFSSNNNDGDIRAVTCDQNDIAGFKGKADYHCNILFTNLSAVLPSGNTPSGYYVRLTPLYQQADLKVKGNLASGAAAKFGNAQAVIDVTAKANNSYKRLSARVDTSSLAGNPVDISGADDILPEYAIRSAGTICKRLNVGLTVTTIDASAIPYCNLSLASSVVAPSVVLNPATNITSSGMTLNGTVNPNGNNVTDCHFEYGTTSAYGTSIACSALPGAGTSAVAVSAVIAGLATGTNYHVRFCATNGAGPVCSADSVFTTSSIITPPPPSGTSCSPTMSADVSGAVTLSGGDRQLPLPTAVTYSWSGNCPAATAGEAYWFQSVCYDITCGSPPVLLGNELGYGSGPLCSAAPAYGVNCFVGAAGGPQSASSGSDGFCVGFGAQDGVGGSGGASGGCFVNGPGSGGPPPPPPPSSDCWLYDETSGFYGMVHTGVCTAAELATNAPPYFVYFNFP